MHLVACVGQKLDAPAPARDLYISTWFKLARAYVEARGGPWAILSAKYGLVLPDQVIEPYDQTLNGMRAAIRMVWADMVDAQMGDLRGNMVTVLAGQAYRTYLMDHLSSRFGTVEVPMRGLTIGRQLQWLSTHAAAAVTNPPVARVERQLIPGS